MDTIGQRIRYLRNRHKLSMEDLGQQIDSNSATISNLENDKSIPGGKILIALSNYFKVSTDWILKGEQNTASLQQEEGRLFYNEKWEVDSRFGQLTVEEKAFVEEYINFVRYRKESSKSPSPKEHTADVPQVVQETLPEQSAYLANDKEKRNKNKKN